MIRIIRATYVLQVNSEFAGWDAGNTIINNEAEVIANMLRQVVKDYKKEVCNTANLKLMGLEISIDKRRV